MRLHALVASAAIAAGVLTFGLPVTRLEARGLGGHFGPIVAPGRPIVHPSYGHPSYGHPSYGRPVYGRQMPNRQPAISYFVEPDHRFGGWRADGWRFGGPWSQGRFLRPYWPGPYAGWSRFDGPRVIGMPYRGWGRFHLVNGPEWADRYWRRRRFEDRWDTNYGGQFWPGDNGLSDSVVSEYGGGVTGSGPDAPYTGSAIYYPPRQARPKAAADADAAQPPRTADARLPRVIYGIQPQWGAPLQGPRIIYSQP
jgi:hypothetical protein